MIQTGAEPLYGLVGLGVFGLADATAGLVVRHVWLGDLVSVSIEAVAHRHIY